MLAHGDRRGRTFYKSAESAVHRPISGCPGWTLWLSAAKTLKGYDSGVSEEGISVKNKINTRIEGNNNNKQVLYLRINMYLIQVFCNTPFPLYR